MRTCKQKQKRGLLKLQARASAYGRQLQVQRAVHRPAPVASAASSSAGGLAAAARVADIVAAGLELACAVTLMEHGARERARHGAIGV